MSQEWRPLQLEGDDTDYDGLHEGIPTWLEPRFLEWIGRQMTTSQDGRTVYRAEQLHELEARLRVALDWSRGGYSALGSLQRYLPKDQEFFLQAIHFVLFQTPRAADSVDKWLLAGGSAWTAKVRDGAAGLERRVDDTIAAAADQVIVDAGRAGTHLARAWKAAYGRGPQPTVAYDESIKAVETAAIPTISPRNDRATLGTLIRDLRAAPQNFSVTLSALGGTDDVETVARVMDLLWKGHPARHGTPNPTRPSAASQSEAEAAAHLAVTLVHWFDKGFVSKR